MHGSGLFPRSGLACMKVRLWHKRLLSLRLCLIQLPSCSPHSLRFNPSPSMCGLYGERRGTKTVSPSSIPFVCVNAISLISRPHSFICWEDLSVSSVVVWTIKFCYVLLTVHLSIILPTDQLNAQILFL